jgi:hypothetical protein
LASHVDDEVGKTVAVFQLASQPDSYPPTPLADSPLPPFKCACFPAPAEGFQPPITAATYGRKRPTVTSYLSSRNPLTCALY